MTIDRCIKLSEIHVLYTTMQLNKAQSGGKDLVQLQVLEEQRQFYLYVNAILNDYKKNGGINKWREQLAKFMN